MPRWFAPGEVVGLDPGLVGWLDELRTMLDRPIVITSGYRTAAQNRAVGGAPDSAHLTGLAADFYVRGLPLGELALAALRWPFTGVGLYPWTHPPVIHVDLRPRSPRWPTRLWIRDAQRTYHMAGTAEFNALWAQGRDVQA